MPTRKIEYGAWQSMTVTNLHSLASDSTDPFTAWQSARVDNQAAVKAIDYEILVKLPMANTAPGGDSAAYVYVCPWVYDGTSWNPGGNFGTTTAPTGAEGAASISDPNSMRGPLVLPYKITQQTLELSFNLLDLFANCPDGFSLVVRNNTGAAVAGSGAIVAYRAITETIA